jgi:hypothetical protein
VHRSSLPGDRRGYAPPRPTAVPRQDSRIDPYGADDRFARFWAYGDDAGHPTFGDDAGHAAFGDDAGYPTFSDDAGHAAAGTGRTSHRAYGGDSGYPATGNGHAANVTQVLSDPRSRNGRRGVHRHVRRGPGKKKWLLVPVAAMAAVLTGGIAMAATGVAGIQFHVASPVTVQALGVNIDHAAVGQTVTAGAKVVAEHTTTLSDVALAVKAPNGTRVDFPHARAWTVGTTQKLFSRSKAFSQSGTYTYWFTYKKSGHWVSVGPKQTFTVGNASAPSPTPSSSPSAPGSPAPTPSPSTSPTGTPSTSPSSGGSSGGSTGGSPGPEAGPSVHGCVSNPGSCGYPTTSTAGVPAGTALTVINGDYIIKTNGAVVENKEIHGCVEVRAANVTIKNTRIVGQCFYGVSTYPATGATVLDRVEINCVNGSGTGLAGPNFAAHAVYIHDCENGLEINQGSSLVDSVISAREGTPTAHGDGIQSQDGNNVVIRHNTLLETNPVTSAIITNPTLNNGWVVEDNFLGGGAYTLYCPEQGTGWTISNNRFVPAKTGAFSAAYGLTDACGHAGITWTGNYLDSNDSTVNP